MVDLQEVQVVGTVYIMTIFQTNPFSDLILLPNDSVWNNHGKVTSTTSTVVNVADGDEGFLVGGHIMMVQITSCTPGTMSLAPEIWIIHWQFE